ncbi:hypothetical protein HaLaN_02284 [Haematococcus lacustris]|uniref:Uncharacterized protein n=1 Tax=Haematococcus lacustris TaxID=44745 RepID=A0A699YHX8_HAELA|nr:hypothetical protein HaLaN_02284 [Haematococcus lacustris]
MWGRSAKVQQLMELAQLRRVWFAAEQAGQHRALAQQVVQGLSTQTTTNIECWEVLTGRNTFTISQLMLIDMGHAPSPTLTALERQYATTNSPCETHSRKRRADEEELAYMELLRQRSLKRSTRDVVPRAPRYVGLITSFMHMDRSHEVLPGITLIRNR